MDQGTEDMEEVDGLSCSYSSVVGGNSDSGDVNNDDMGNDYNRKANLMFSDNIVVAVLCCTRI